MLSCQRCVPLAGPAAPAALSPPVSGVRRAPAPASSPSAATGVGLCAAVLPLRNPVWAPRRRQGERRGLPPPRSLPWGGGGGGHAVRRRSRNRGGGCIVLLADPVLRDRQGVAQRSARWGRNPLPGPRRRQGSGDRVPAVRHRQLRERSRTEAAAANPWPTHTGLPHADGRPRGDVMLVTGPRVPGLQLLPYLLRSGPSPSAALLPCGNILSRCLLELLSGLLGPSGGVVEPCPKPRIEGETAAARRSELPDDRSAMCPGHLCGEAAAAKGRPSHSMLVVSQVAHRHNLSGAAKGGPLHPLLGADVLGGIPSPRSVSAPPTPRRLIIRVDLSGVRGHRSAPVADPHVPPAHRISTVGPFAEEYLAANFALPPVLPVVCRAAAAHHRKSFLRVAVICILASAALAR